MRITDVLLRDDVLLDVEATSRRGVFEAVGALFAARHGLNRAQISNALYAREQLGSTGLGYGVAIPHARLGGAAHAIAAYIRTRMPIPFEAPDGKPVSDMIVLIVPAHANETHLQLLADVANLFASKEFREHLRATSGRSKACTRCSATGLVTMSSLRMIERAGIGWLRALRKVKRLCRPLDSTSFGRLQSLAIDARLVASFVTARRRPQGDLAASRSKAEGSSAW